MTLHLPFEVADYVDFYASLDHATNVGRMFRPDSEPLHPELAAPADRLPRPGRHRRGLRYAGHPAVRAAQGARRDAPRRTARRRRLDIEAELGFVVGAPSELGAPVPFAGLADHVFGVTGLNDWSARDIQAWEYVPLGPFLGKSFATSISPWVTPLAALDAAWVDLPGQDPEPLPYLGPGATRGLDIDVEVELNGEVVSRPPYRTMYWSPAQMLAHMTVNGASLRTGDLFASGTISGPEPRPARLVPRAVLGRQGAVRRDGPARFLEDGDEVVLRYSAPGHRRRPDHPRRGRRAGRARAGMSGPSVTTGWAQVCLAPGRVPPAHAAPPQHTSGCGRRSGRTRGRGHPRDRDRAGGHRQPGRRVQQRRAPQRPADTFPRSRSASCR